MDTQYIPIIGRLAGKHFTDAAGIVEEEVIWITDDGPSKGPAENSVIVVTVFQNGRRSARYMSWIVGYGDLDIMKAKSPASWELLEPARSYEANVAWNPFGR